MKVLVTGSGGMLGSSLVDLLPYETIGYSSNKLDIADFNKVDSVISEEKPNIIIHTAAYTNVEDCEVNHNKAYLVNTIGTQNLVNCCIDKDILFIYISSTGVYGNSKKEEYTEFDVANPTTIHHMSKYEAEKIVQNHLDKYLILRTGWLFGGHKEHGKNFVYKRYLEALKHSEIFSDNSQIGNPTYIKDLIEQIQVLIHQKQLGIYNCVNEARNVSRYEYVVKIVELFQQDCVVKIAPKGMFKRVAPVSQNESAINYKLELLNLNIMNHWQEALNKYIQELKKEMS